MLASTPTNPAQAGKIRQGKDFIPAKAGIQNLIRSDSETNLWNPHNPPLLKGGREDFWDGACPRGIF
jgi:hypothetical protein